MRAVLLISAAALSAVLASGCDSLRPSPSSTPQGTAVGSATTDAPPDATDTVCGKIRSTVSTHMSSLGTAMGRYVGYQLADNDDAVEDEQEAIDADIRSMASDISRFGATASDASLRSTAGRVARALDAIAADLDFVTDIDSMSDVPPAIDKLRDTAQPLAEECAQP